MSGPQAEAFLLPELLFFFFFPLVLGLDLQVPYHSAMTGTVKDITQTRVSHHSEPLEVAEPDTVSGVWSAVLNKPYRAAAIR